MTTKQPKTPRRDRTPTSSTTNLTNTVQVFCRLRPLKNDEESTCIKLISPTVLKLITPPDSKVSRADHHYTFKHIFTSYSDQKEIFEHIALPAIEDVLHAKNGLVFTYGVTGSGKTYTLTGNTDSPGILPRSINVLFNSIEDLQAPKYVLKPDKMNGFEVQSAEEAARERYMEEKSNRRKPNLDMKSNFINDGMKIMSVDQKSLYSVFISYVEIYNNVVYDLLDESSGKTLQAKILREDANKNMYVNGAVEVEVKTAAEAFELFTLGQKRKRMGHTVLNADSSRSHLIFLMRVVQVEQDFSNGNGGTVIPEQNCLKIGQMAFVDLAGSERTSRTNNTGMHLKEASSINNSLLTLRKCLNVLRDNQLNGTNQMVPYRDSRLTFLFKNYFEGEGLVQMIVCINPSVQDFEENLQVVKFAEITQDVKIIKPETKGTPFKTPKKQIQPTTPSSARSVCGLSGLGPAIPRIKLDLSDPESFLTDISRLTKILQTRKQRWETTGKNTLKAKEKHFRKRLVEIEHENTLSRTEINNARTLLRKAQTKSKNMETEIEALKTENAEVVAKRGELEEVIRELRQMLDEKDMRINRNALEKHKYKQKIQQQEEKMTQELDAKLRRQREHLRAETRKKDEQIQLVKRILDSDVDVGGFEDDNKDYIASEVQTDDIENISPRKNPVLSPPSSRRRRSRSAGEVWLEHNSIKPVPLGTVLQPAIKKRKSVTQLSKASDVTNPKQSKYCLITQDADENGDLETKVYKGDIVKTCGGGAQVIFDDIEKLRQESPCK